MPYLLCIYFNQKYKYTVICQINMKNQLNSHDSPLIFTIYVALSLLSTELMCLCIFLTGMTEPEGQAQQNIYPELNPTSAVSADQPMGILEVGLIIIHMHLHLVLLLHQIYKFCYVYNIALFSNVI